jgi:peroxiredoxin
MKTKVLITLLILAAFTALYFLREARRMTPGRGAPDSPAVGTNAPDFSVTDSKGKTQSLSQYKGKHVVLEWFNPECPFVKKHYGSGNMQKLQEEFTAKDIVWLTIDSSAPDKQGHLTADQANQIITKLKMKSTALLIDADGKTGQTYGAKNTPHMFVINPEGKIVYEGAIDSRNSTNAADIPSSTNYVKVALEESMAGKPVSNAITQPYGCSVKYK